MARQIIKSREQLIYEAAVAELAKRREGKMLAEAQRNGEIIKAEALKFSGFVKNAWPVLEPNTPLVIGWGIEAIMEHLQAVTDGDLTRLWVNVPPGFAKAMDEDTPVLTTWGWKRHHDLKPGDFVFGPDGKPKRVLAESHDYYEDGYELEFDDGTVLVAGAHHEWVIEREFMDSLSKWRRVRRKMTVETKDLVFGMRGDCIGVSKPISLKPENLVVDPYLLGAWLGDGATDSGCLYASEQDIAHFKTLGEIGAIYPPDGTRKQTFYRIKICDLQTKLRVIGLIGNKHIPNCYLESSFEQRISLLQGLMDTDGTCGKNGLCSFTNKNKSIADGLCFLVESLGMKAYRKSRFTKLNGKTYGPHYYVTFHPPEGIRIFRLDRKQDRVRPSTTPRTFKRYIKNISNVGPRRTKCIQVEGGIYLAGKQLCPTHNSLLLNVLWPAFEWGPKDMQWMRYVATSGDESLTTRDGKKFRDLITSAWYQELWPVNMTALAIGEMNNDKTGARYGVPFSGMMGWRGDRLCIDDPHNLKNEKSDAMRGETVRLFKEGASSRLNDVVKGAIVGVMQMVGVGDMSNYIKDNDPTYTYLCIPQEFDPERKCITYRKNGIKLFEDPRKRPGQLAFPERFPKEWVEKEKSAKHGIGIYAFSAQHQQNAIPRGEGLFKREWFEGKIIDSWDLQKFRFIKTVRYFDLADTNLAALKKTGARTATIKMAITKNKDFVILHAYGFGLSGAKKDAEIKKVADGDEQSVEMFFPQDPASGGKVQARAMISLLAGRIVKAILEREDKVARAEPFANQCQGGNVYMLRAGWNEELIAEYETFPFSGRKDLVDASSGAFSQLLTAKRGDPMHGLVAPIVLEIIDTEEFSDGNV